MNVEGIWNAMDGTPNGLNSDQAQGLVCRALALLDAETAEHVLDGIYFASGATCVIYREWVGDRDLILVNPDTTERDVLHEVAHWVLGHGKGEENQWGTVPEVEAQEAAAWAWADARLPRRAAQ